MNNFFYNIYQYFNPRKWIGFGVLGILFFAVLFIASKIKFEEDITKLIPSNKENLELQKVLKNVNFTDKIIINITKETAGSVDDLTQYASQLIDSINKSSSKYIKQIQGKIDDDQIGITADFIYKSIKE